MNDEMSRLDLEYAKKLSKLICPECHVAMMYEHWCEYGFEKCILCGFTRKLEKNVPMPMTGNRQSSSSE